MILCSRFLFAVLLTVFAHSLNVFWRKSHFATIASLVVAPPAFADSAPVVRVDFLQKGSETPRKSHSFLTSSPSNSPLPFLSNFFRRAAFRGLRSAAESPHFSSTSAVCIALRCPT